MLVPKLVTLIQGICSSHFIPCGVWEAIYILEGLLKNTSDLQPTTVHGDTQAQSTPVFGLAHLLGIKLMPRIRNWKDLTFFRPSKDVHYHYQGGVRVSRVDVARSHPFPNALRGCDAGLADAGRATHAGY
jgi:TnpA family transposase